MDKNASRALTDLSDRALLDKAAELALVERVATADLIEALAEVDARKLYLGQGCSSMFVYCTRLLHLSEHAAYDRIEAARLGRKFPVIFDRLACGSLTLSNLRLLAPYLTPETADALLDESAYKSKHEVEALTLNLRPSAEAGPERYTIQLQLTVETREKLQRAQELLRHAIPDGDPAAIFDRALTLLIAEVEKKKAGVTSRPRGGRRPRRRSRDVPRSVKREVWERDGGQCAFVGEQGRCTERGYLEFHHIVSYAAGGETVTENLALRCQAHNQHEAAVCLGESGASFVRERRPAWFEPAGPGTSAVTGPGTSSVSGLPVSGSRTPTAPLSKASVWGASP